VADDLELELGIMENILMGMHFLPYGFLEPWIDHVAKKHGRNSGSDIG